METKIPKLPKPERILIIDDFLGSDLSQRYYFCRSKRIYDLTKRKMKQDFPFSEKEATAHAVFVSAQKKIREDGLLVTRNLDKDQLVESIYAEYGSDFSLILLDLRFPIPDSNGADQQKNEAKGYEYCNALSSADNELSEIPIILMTEKNSDLEKSYKRYNIVAHVTKDNLVGHKLKELIFEHAILDLDNLLFLKNHGVSVKQIDRALCFDITRKKPTRGDGYIPDNLKAFNLERRKVIALKYIREAEKTIGEFENREIEKGVLEKLALNFQDKKQLKEAVEGIVGNFPERQVLTIEHVKPQLNDQKARAKAPVPADLDQLLGKIESIDFSDLPPEQLKGIYNAIVKSSHKALLNLMQASFDAPGYTTLIGSMSLLGHIRLPAHSAEVFRKTVLLPEMLMLETEHSNEIMKSNMTPELRAKIKEYDSLNKHKRLDEISKGIKKE